MFDHSWSILIQEHVEQDVIVVISNRIKINRSELRDHIHRDIENEDEVDIDLREQDDGVEDFVDEGGKALESSKRKCQHLVVESARMIVHVLHDVLGVGEVWENVQMHYSRGEELCNE